MKDDISTQCKKMKFELADRCLSSSVIEVFDSLLQELKEAVRGVIKTVCCCHISVPIRYTRISQNQHMFHISRGESHESHTDRQRVPMRGYSFLFMPFQMSDEGMSLQWHVMPPLSSYYIAINKSNTLREKKRSRRRRTEMRMSTCL